MLTVGDAFPEFSLTAVTDDSLEFSDVTNKSYKGKWLVVFFWPKDFTFICPTEITKFGEMTDEFAKRDAQVLGVSTDSEFVHHAWRTSHPGLKDLPFPMLSDIRRDLSTQLGILDREAGVALRATFIVDPEGTIQYVSVHGLNQGRNVEEILRSLDAIQSGELAPCGWKPGEATIKVG